MFVIFQVEYGVEPICFEDGAALSNTAIYILEIKKTAHATNAALDRAEALLKAKAPAQAKWSRTPSGVGVTWHDTYETFDGEYFDETHFERWITTAFSPSLESALIYRMDQFPSLEFWGVEHVEDLKTA